MQWQCKTLWFPPEHLAASIKICNKTTAEKEKIHKGEFSSVNADPGGNADATKCILTHIEASYRQRNALHFTFTC